MATSRKDWEPTSGRYARMTGQFVLTFHSRGRSAEIDVHS